MQRNSFSPATPAPLPLVAEQVFTLRTQLFRPISSPPSLSLWRRLMGELCGGQENNLGLALG